MRAQPLLLLDHVNVAPRVFKWVKSFEFDQDRNSLQTRLFGSLPPFFSLAPTMELKSLMKAHEPCIKLVLDIGELHPQRSSFDIRSRGINSYKIKRGSTQI